MSGGIPVRIDFAEYTENIPANIPVAVQQATGRFLGTRAQRVAEMPQWEELRQAAHELRIHTLLHLDHYLEQLERQVRQAVTFTGLLTLPRRAISCWGSPASTPCARP
jgi:L-lactate dehydrogenase complex protein LldF